MSIFRTSWPELLPSEVRLLIVEDEAIIAERIKKTLIRLGYQVIGMVSSGEGAIEFLAQAQPDLVLMDIVLSGRMDGIETAAIIQGQYRLPLIYLTSYGDNEIIQRAKPTGPYGYLVKPVQERELHAAIEIALHRHRWERDREQLVQELQAALASIKTLSGLLTMCANCKKIRDSRGDWHRLEEYLSRNTIIEAISHGYCPDCSQKMQALVDEMPD